MSEAPEAMSHLESPMNEIAAKTNMIDEMAGCLKAMSVSELMSRVEALKEKTTIASGFKCRDSSMDSGARIEEHVVGLTMSNERSFRWS